MESESQTAAMIGNWLFFFVLAGGAIYSGVRFSKLALSFGYNRYVFGAIGVVLYLSLIRGYAALVTYLFPGPSWTMAFMIAALAIATTSGVYLLLKRSWQNRQRE